MTTVLLRADLMPGHGIDQILPNPGDPVTPVRPVGSGAVG
jgi:hypothetical protein